MLKTVQSIDEMNNVQMMKGGVIGHGALLGVFFHSPDKEFWACLGDVPSEMPRRLDSGDLVLVW